MRKQSGTNVFFPPHPINADPIGGIFKALEDYDHIKYRETEIAAHIKATENTPDAVGKISIAPNPLNPNMYNLKIGISDGGILNGHLVHYPDGFQLMELGPQSFRTLESLKEAITQKLKDLGHIE